MHMGVAVSQPTVLPKDQALASPFMKEFVRLAHDDTGVSMALVQGGPRVTVDSDHFVVLGDAKMNVIKSIVGPSIQTLSSTPVYIGVGRNATATTTTAPLVEKFEDLVVTKSNVGLYLLLAAVSVWLLLRR